MRLFGVGLATGVAIVLRLGILFWIVFAIVGWIYVAPKIYEKLR